MKAQSKKAAIVAVSVSLEDTKKLGKSIHQALNGITKQHGNTIDLLRKIDQHGQDLLKTQTVDQVKEFYALHLSTLLTAANGDKTDIDSKSMLGQEIKKFWNNVKKAISNNKLFCFPGGESLQLEKGKAECSYKPEQRAKKADKTDKTEQAEQPEQKAPATPDEVIFWLSLQPLTAENLAALDKVLAVHKARLAKIERKTAAKQPKTETA